MKHNQTLNSTWPPNLKALRSLSKFEPWTPMVALAMFLKMKPGYLYETETSNLVLTLTLVVWFFSAFWCFKTTRASSKGAFALTLKTPCVNTKLPQVHTRCCFGTWKRSPT